MPHLTIAERRVPRSLRQAFAVVLIASAGVAAADRGMVTLSVKVGPHFVQKRQAGPYTIRPRPQMACWLETPQGAYVSTMFVTSKTGRNAWIMSGTSRRPYVVPVWAHKWSAAARSDSLMPTPGFELPDAVAGATPAADFTWQWPVPDTLRAGNYVARFEVNNSFDYNEQYRDDIPPENSAWSEYNGQPSLVWQGTIALGDRPATATLKRTGTGDLLGRNGSVTLTLQGLTTALRIVDSVTVSFRPSTARK